MRIFGGIATVAASAYGGRTDAELLSAHVSGDEQAFRILLHRHYDYLWLVARRASPTVDDAADSLQDALLSAHRRAATFREDSAVRSWLHTIVVNACLDRVRRSRSRPTVPLIEDTLRASVRDTDPIVDAEMSLDIATALQSLSPDQRAAIVAVDVEGYSVRDAARRLGVPVGTVKSRCARGRQRLAELLGDLRDRGNRS